MDANWDDYRFFLAIAHAGSLTAAGRALGVSQPTVSRRLDDLESSLKVRLFDRTHRGYELTALGMELFEAVEQVEERLGEAGRKIYGQDQNLIGSLRVTCTEIFFNGYLAPAVWRFLSNHPGIHFSVKCTDSSLSLGRRDADLAVRFVRRPPEGLVGRRLSAVAYAVYGSRDAKPAPSEITRGEWNWIGAVDDLHNRFLFADAFPEGQFKHRVDTVEAMQSMTRSGLGVTVLPCYIGDRDEGLRRLQPDRLLDCGVDLWILHHPDIRNVYRVRLFADFIAETIKEDQDLFDGRRMLKNAP
jgi:DNA-binding transcriptional LysR family regulator